MSPLLMLMIGVVIVIVMILVFRANAFLALILAALAVSLMAEGDWAKKGELVATALGESTGKIGIVVAMAAIIGNCMMKSGAAEKIVMVLCRLCGEKRFATALSSSGFVLSIPVFYDTVFYLLVPLVRSFYQKMHKNYMLCLMAICAGAMITHTMVPPTPGPLIIATNLGIPVAHMIMLGLLIGVFLFPVGMVTAHLINWYLPNPKVNLPHDDMPQPSDMSQIDVAGSPVEKMMFDNEKSLPPITWALLPIVLPVVLIAVGSFLEMYQSNPGIKNATGGMLLMINMIKVLGSKEIAMMIAALLSLLVYYFHKKVSRHKVAQSVETALLDAGLIILITAAGGAFGSMLQHSGIGNEIKHYFENEQGVAGISILFIAFCIASMLKLSLGSSTTAMITTSAILKPMLLTTGVLGYNLAYLGLAISCGSLVTSWMNDSGFWVTSRMAGLSEIDTLKSVSVLHIAVGAGGFVLVLIFSQLFPCTSLVS